MLLYLNLITTVNGMDGKINRFVGRDIGFVRVNILLSV